ncbi:hypothetical protein F4860DRAFT_481723 [Xylaria cubensis]|nr:hypothetical protein F4860DRAFT_481723 [Xylaria cubensis]
MEVAPAVMVVNGGRQLAAQVCVVCRARKKKCNKVLPSCSTCSRKGLNCQYPELSSRSPIRVHSRQTSRSRPLPIERRQRNSDALELSSDVVLSGIIPLEPAASEASIYAEANRLIRSTSRFLDDVSASYFQSIHRYLPFISRVRFQSDLVTVGAVPSAGFSVLLLSMCLATMRTKPDAPAVPLASGTRKADRKALHLATRSLYSQVQTLFPPSLSLIQAGLLLSLYEYGYGRPDDALASIAGCARMAYAARIHRSSSYIPRSPKPTDDSSILTETDIRLEVEEAANTWWGIIICERTFLCEATTSDQPPIAMIPSGHPRLPTEPEILESSNFDYLTSSSGTALTDLGAVDVRGFGRAAQTAWLVDQVLNSYNIANFNARLSRLVVLDESIQAFLSSLMQQCQGEGGVFCEAIALTIRLLYNLHWHILDTEAEGENADLLTERLKHSRVALQVITNIVLDIVGTHDTPAPCLFQSVSSTYSYMIRAALNHVHSRTQWKGDNALQDIEGRLRVSLDRFNQYN